jgi:hypothetical protein
MVEGREREWRMQTRLEGERKESQDPCIGCKGESVRVGDDDYD